jgi:Raf kinase inhibitor-like YbhB/YbcL family protein
MTIKLHSPAFSDQGQIPKEYTEDGSDVSPPLAWENVPSGTQELALVCDDPDAPTKEPWVHWVMYKIPADRRALEENIPPQARLVDSPPGAMQGRNSWPSGRTIGYRGPAPPRGHGTHHYQFRIYALDAPLSLEPQLDKTALLRAIHGHVLAQGLLIGTYGR